MRDIVIVAMVLAAAMATLRRPWIGVLCWTWLSIMNPHRFAYGFAYSAPLAAIAAGTTLLALVFTPDKHSPFKGSPVVWFTLFTVWVTVSWLMGVDPSGDYPQWNKVMKINLMILVALALFHSKLHIFALTWVVIGSLALLGVKGGVFTILHGGNYRVWGPPGSFIEDNNEFALALILAVPMLRFLQMQVASRWGRHALSAGMLLCVASALGSHSRGALLAITTMALLLWWRGRSRVVGGVFILAVALTALSFLPEHWFARMETIRSYEEDRSAMGRISAWWTAWNIAKSHFFGVGFNPGRPELFAVYSPYPEFVHAAHSIYFQVMGNHGFFGLFLFLAIWITTWRQAGWLRQNGGSRPETRWCADLGAMCQVSLAGFAVGGAFLSLAYFDLPYNLMVLVVVTRVWVQTEAWRTTPIYPNTWRTLPGLLLPTDVGARTPPPPVRSSS